jgi:ADAMTS-like protein 1/3
MEQHLKYTIEAGERAVEDDPQAMRQTAALDKSITDSIDFEYYVGPWSGCSQTCGPNDSGYRVSNDPTIPIELGNLSRAAVTINHPVAGSFFNSPLASSPSLIPRQLRTVHCMVRIKNTTKNVDNILCEDAGLKAPDTIEKCGNIECPKWTSTDWSACRKSKCFAWHTALQKRDVSCSFGNETVSDKCDESEKPTTKQECYNELCKGVWRVEQWSEVRPFVSLTRLFAAC